MFPLSLCYMCIMETSVKNMSPFGLINAYMYTHTHTSMDMIRCIILMHFAVSQLSSLK